MPLKSPTLSRTWLLSSWLGCQLPVGHLHLEVPGEILMMVTVCVLAAQHVKDSAIFREFSTSPRQKPENIKKEWTWLLKGRGGGGWVRREGEGDCGVS